MTELKPCPFCGGQPDIAISKYGRYVTCPCSLNPRTNAFEDVSKAIEQWNNRPNPWHTGTPTEIKGWFLFKYRAYGKFVYRAVENPVVDIFADSELEWQKIELYEEKEE